MTETVQTKRCTKCGEVKPLGDYSPHARAPFGVQPRCKKCCAAANSARYHANIEVYREKSRLRALEDQRKNPEQRNASRKKWREANPGKDRMAKREWIKRNKDQHDESKERWRLENPDKVNAAARARWKHQTPEQQKRSILRAKYGMTLEQYRAMIAAQGGRCAICRTDNPAKHGQWCVDHDHATGKVRALLCVKCNAGLGNFCERPEFLMAAIDYLVEHGAPGLLPDLRVA